MANISIDQVDRVIQESDNQKSGEVALCHLEEVIACVVSEAVEYADKPPGERTLPVLVRKSNTQTRIRQSFEKLSKVHMNMQNNNDMHTLGLNRMNASFAPGFQSSVINAGNQKFSEKSQSNQMLNMSKFAPLQNNTLEQTQHLINQYNELQPGRYQSHTGNVQQHYAQAAHQFQLQAQSQYQGSSTNAFTQMQLHQQQQAAAAIAAAAAAAAASPSLLYAVTSSVHGGSPSFPVIPPGAGVQSTSSTVNHQQVQHQTQQQQALVAAAAQQQLHQLSAAYAAAQHLPSMMQNFSSTPQQHQAQQRWTNAASIAAYQTASSVDQPLQQQQFDSAALLHEQQRQYFQQRSQQGSASVSDLVRYAAYQQQ